jgi:hypothetical protein
MHPFRKHLPKRRTVVPSVGDYKEYKDLLHIDFKEKCGYCDDKYTWRTTWFEIDHLIPQKKFPHRNPTDYGNLVYSCRSCNNSKRAKWPTENENIFHDGAKGFIDPCDPSYDQQFRRKEDGTIRYQTELGKWLLHALRLHRPQHQIIWIIEQIDNNIEELEFLLISIKDSSIKNNIKNNLLQLHQFYRKYTKQLGEQ